MFAIVFSVVNVYLDHLKFCVVCVYGRMYVCCDECYVVSNECLLVSILLLLLVLSGTIQSLHFHLLTEYFPLTCHILSNHLLFLS